MTNNPFDQFDIEHLSASSINLFIQDISLFIVRYLAKHKSPTNSAMLRGTVIDHAIGEKHSVKEAQKEFMSLMNYHKKEGVTFDEVKAETEYNNIEKYLEVGLPFYEGLGEPVSYQKKVELKFDDLPIPVIGYVDLEYEDCIRDIKTTAKRPSELLPPVQRQVAVYATALEKDRAYADYLYVTKTKAEVISFEVDDIDMRLNEVYRVASAMMNLLQNNDIYSLVDQFYPDFSNWMWSDSDRAVAKELWRIK
jgi:hypothetical protein|tara:strand:- start:5257 stop:6009 length:753 start_codon:yes stop_codon:yes gene_type:complete